KIAGGRWPKRVRPQHPGPAREESKPWEAGGGGKVLAGLLRSLATYLMSEEDESKLWTRTNQCLPCLLRLRKIQEEAYVVDETAESVIERVRARTMMPRKDEPQAPPVEDPEVDA